MLHEPRGLGNRREPCSRPSSVTEEPSELDGMLSRGSLIKHGTYSVVHQGIWSRPGRADEAVAIKYLVNLISSDDLAPEEVRRMNAVRPYRSDFRSYAEPPFSIAAWSGSR